MSATGDPATRISLPCTRSVIPPTSVSRQLGWSPSNKRLSLPSYVLPDGLCSMAIALKNTSSCHFECYGDFSPVRTVLDANKEVLALQQRCSTQANSNGLY